MTSPDLWEWFAPLLARTSDGSLSAADLAAMVRQRGDQITAAFSEAKRGVGTKPFEDHLAEVWNLARAAILAFILEGMVEAADEGDEERAHRLARITAQLVA